MANQVTPIQAGKRKALASVRRGILDTPKRVLIYGSEKVGKSTFASGAPSPIFIGAESGTEQLDVERLEPSSWSEALAWLDELAHDAHEYRTVVIDPASWFEPLCWDHVCQRNGWAGIEAPGFGKGYSAAFDEWRTMVKALERCRTQKGMHVIITAHSQVKKFENPEGSGYERYELAMHKQAAGLLKQWVDYVLFAQVETFTNVDPQSKKTKGIASGRRVIRATPSAAYDAGARWTLPEDLLLSWDDFSTAISSAATRAAELVTQINAMTSQVNDPKVTEFSTAFVEKNKTKVDRLTELVNRLSVRVNEKNKETTKS